MRLNPQREEKLLEITGWSRLQPGTLNVECNVADLPKVLDGLEPLWHEPWESVTYPRKYRRIPERRRGYRYYSATLAFTDRRVPVLIRRAVNPLKRRIEVYAESSLRETLDIKDGDAVSISFQQ